jgi:hypothetical protein
MAPQNLQISRDIDSPEFQDQLRKHQLDPSEQNPFLLGVIRLKISEINYDERFVRAVPFPNLKPKSRLSSIRTPRPQQPCFILRAIPLELRHLIFETIAYRERTISVDLHTRGELTYGPFHHLSKTCKALRGEISEWASKRRDIVDSPLYGPICPSVTTFNVTFLQTGVWYEEHRTYKAPQSRRQVFRFAYWKYCMQKIKSNDKWVINKVIFQQLKRSEEIPLRFMSGVLGVSVGEITSDVFQHQSRVMTPYYDQGITKNYHSYGLTTWVLGAAFV